jgi:hypothetical protein
VAGKDINRSGGTTTINPIYQLLVSNNDIAGNQAWKALSEAEQKARTDQEKASRDAVGAKMIVMCDSA